MPYASVQDCIDRLGQEFVDQLSDDPSAGTLAWRELETALSDASEEIDGYIGARHSLPLDPAPGALKRTCASIAIYERCHSADLATEQIADRAGHARKLLRDVASGLVSLGIEDPDRPASAAEPGVSFTSSERVMGRDSLRGAL